MKANVGLIGKGKWGKIIKSKLIKISNLKFSAGKKENYLKLIKNNYLNWIFIVTPNNTHFKIVKNCLNLKLNVFCEKPLTTTYKKTKELINIAKKNNVKLYISDIYSFHNLKIKKLLLRNSVFRSKRVSKQDKEFLFRFMYHDISILFNYLKKLRIKSIKVHQNKKKIIKIKIKFNNDRLIVFKYCLNSPTKRHIINDINFISKKDILKKMLTAVLNGKIRIKSNNDKAMFISKFLDIMKKKI